jgi:hypothetical protein
MRAGNCRDIIEKTKFENERSYFTLVAHYFDCAQNAKGFACDPSVFLRRATTHTGWCVVKRTKRTNERTNAGDVMRMMWFVIDARGAAVVDNGGRA